MKKLKKYGKAMRIRLEYIDFKTRHTEVFRKSSVWGRGKNMNPVPSFIDA